MSERKTGEHDILSFIEPDTLIGAEAHLGGSGNEAPRLLDFGDLR